MYESDARRFLSEDSEDDRYGKKWRATSTLIDCAFASVDSYAIQRALRAAGMTLKDLRVSLGYEGQDFRRWGWRVTDRGGPATFGEYHDPLWSTSIDPEDRHAIRRFAEDSLRDQQEANPDDDSLLVSVRPTSRQHFVVSQAWSLAAMGFDLGRRPHLTVVALREIGKLLRREPPPDSQNVTSDSGAAASASWWADWYLKNGTAIESVVREDSTFGIEQQRSAVDWSFPRLGGSTQSITNDDFPISLPTSEALDRYKAVRLVFYSYHDRPFEDFGAEPIEAEA